MDDGHMDAAHQSDPWTQTLDAWAWAHQPNQWALGANAGRPTKPMDGGSMDAWTQADQRNQWTLTAFGTRGEAGRNARTATDREKEP